MPKIKKQLQKQDSVSQNIQRVLTKQSMFNSALITYLLAGVVFIISFILNGQFVTIPNTNDETWIKVIDVLLKGGSIGLFFFFAFIAFANWMELKGYIMELKHIIILIVISILQSVMDIYVFLTALVCIIVVLAYMYFIQAKAPKAE